ncbi:MAG TPA: hypothetical protein VMT47_02470 [Polyangia bacterium]|nr:hypothetical protein [Polyangia bacterium]
MAGGAGAEAAPNPSKSTPGETVLGPPSPDPTQTEKELAEAQKKAAEAQKALEAAQADLKATLEAMQAELGAEREQRAEEVIGLREKLEKAQAALKKPPVSTPYPGVGLTGYVQADWTVWRQSSEDEINPSTLAPVNEERFMIRRARLKTTIDREYVAGALELDGNTVNGTTARLVNAEASFKLPGEDGAPVPLLMATIGLFKIPFGFEIVQSDRDRIFLERSTAEQALFPGEYDLGARLQGGWRFVRYAVAVQNGDPLGEKAYPGRDPNAAKDIVGRLGIETPIVETVTVSAGFSGLTGKGFHRGTPATKSVIQWSDKNEDGAFTSDEIVTVPGSAATPSQNFDRFGYGADLNLSVAIPQFGVATIYGELYYAKNLDRAKLIADPLGPLGRDARELGFYVAALLQIGELATVGARYDAYNPDRDSTNSAKPLVPTDLSYSTLALVAAVGTPNGRVQLEYDHNTNHSGRDLMGRPANLKDDAVILRGQVGF